ncbi:MAG TPA: malto-oligosyltrehalose trehalohydrolase [Methylomirabilota bacterium]
MGATPGWRPTVGALPEEDGTRFRVWAPAAGRVELAIGPEGGEIRPLTAEPGGYWTGWHGDLPPGTLYRYRLDGGSPGLPDPASRAQPLGVHGPSAVVDPTAFRWQHDGWATPARHEIVVYELHVGTFTPEGTFQAAAARLDALVDLGVTTIELMPLADFPGDRNWGYDGVSLFAPARCYGPPDDLRRLVDRAHGLGLAVVIDVVYNHLGPDGNYLWSYGPYFTERHHTPWGAAVNLDGEASPHVRRFLIENACHWVNEYRMDGLRLDATHALIDDSARHFLGELAATVRETASERDVWVVAEDHRNLAMMVAPEPAGGWGLDAVWADDLHHEIRCHIAGDRDGYYADYTGAAGDIAATIRQGWFYTGQYSAHRGGPRGTDPAGLAPERFVVCIQNHDQVGNRALGDRLHQTIPLASWRAASALLLAVPEVPLLFMGQEWAASTPFLYFTDHHEELGRLVTQGRRDEFRHFAAFADPSSAAGIPDPQAPETFAASRLDWDEPEREPHASVRRLYRALLELRRTLRPVAAGEVRARAFGPHAVGVERQGAGGPLVAVCRLTGEGAVELDGLLDPADDWKVRLTTEDAGFAPDPLPPRLETSGAGARVVFGRPGAVWLERAA